MLDELLAVEYTFINNLVFLLLGSLTALLIMSCIFKDMTQKSDPTIKYAAKDLHRV
jgi:hypothetical protein